MAASLILDANEVSVDALKNTSRLYVRLQIRTTGGTYNHAGDTLGTIAVNGKSYSLAGKNVDYNTTTTLYEDTHTITHNSDGSKSVTVAAEFDPNTPGTSRLTLSKTVTLTAIPRASTLAATDANIGGVSMVAVNRRSSDYTHSIAYTFGKLTGYLKADGSLSNTEVRFSDTAVGFALPERFYTQIPNDPSGICTLTCTTYKGTAKLGDPQTATFTVTADMAACAPTATLTVTEADEKIAALTGGGNLVRYASTARCTLEATPRNGATVEKFFINGVEGDTLLIPGVENNSFTFTVTDSRGYSCSGAVVAAMVDYIPLTANLTAGRTDPTSGNAKLTLSGNYYAAQFGKSVNELTLHCTVGDTEVTLTPTFTERGYEATANVSGLDYRQSHGVQVVVNDKVSTLELAATIGKGVPVFHWGEEDFCFNVPVSIPEPAQDSHAINRKYAREHFLSGSGAAQLTSPVSVVGQNFPSFAIRREKDGDILAGMTVNAASRRLYFPVYNPDMDGKTTRYAERYLLPLADTGLSKDRNYDILTSKTPVAVAQGGTGASDAVAARQNLGLGCTKLLAGEGTAAGHGNYKMYLVMGRPAQNASLMTMLIPAAEVGATAERYQIADNTDYVAFSLSATGGNITATKTAGNGNLTAIYGVN